MNIYWSIALSCVMQIITSLAADPCSTVQVKNTMYQKGREGQYELLSTLCNGKVTYQQSPVSPSNTNYIFYTRTSGWNGWMVGPVLCGSQGGLAAQSLEDTPQEVTSVWEEAYAMTWWLSYSVTVTCVVKRPSDGLSAGAVCGIVTGVLLAMSLTIAVIVVCMQTANKQRTAVGASANGGSDRVHVTTVSSNLPAYSMQDGGAIVAGGAEGVVPYFKYPSPPPSYSDTFAMPLPVYSSVHVSSQSNNRDGLNIQSERSDGQSGQIGQRVGGAQAPVVGHGQGQGQVNGAFDDVNAVQPPPYSLFVRQTSANENTPPSHVPPLESTGNTH